MVSRSAGTSMSRIYGIGWTFCMSYSRVNMASMTEMAQRLVHGMNSRGMRRTDTVICANGNFHCYIHLA